MGGRWALPPSADVDGPPFGFTLLSGNELGCGTFFKTGSVPKASILRAVAAPLSSA